jgi:hypothetical protein
VPGTADNINRAAATGFLTTKAGICPVTAVADATSYITHVDDFFELYR